MRSPARLIFLLIPLAFTSLQAMPPQAAAPAVLAADKADNVVFSGTAESLQLQAANVRKGRDAQATMLLNEELITFDRDGRITDTLHVIYRIENEDGVKDWADLTADWEPWHQSKPEVHARVVSPDGSVHTLDPKTLTDVPVHENAPETYSDDRAYGGPLPAIAVGAIVEEEIITRDTAPFFTGGVVQRLHLSKTVPVEKTRIVLTHPASLPLRYVVQEMPEAKVTKATTNGIETIQIESGRMEARNRKLTHLPSDIVPGPQIEFSWGGSWQQVASEYDRQTRDKLRATDVESLLAAARATKSGGSRREQIDRLVATLHKNVRYTGVEFGEASIIPQFPSEVLKRKYGDCKDKAALLVTMLRASGMPATLALLDSGPGQDVNPELPGMGMFDHAIVYVPAGASDPELWIDATAQFSRVGDLPEMDYGRWALIVDQKTTGLKKIPELTAEQNVHREFREFTLPEFGEAVIVEKNQDSGPGEAGSRETYASEDKELRDNIESYVKRAYLAEKLTSIQHGDVADLTKPFSVSFTTKGRRGNTDYENAVVAIRLEDLFNGFPDYFTTPEDDKNDDDKKEDAGEEAPDKEKPRTQDWQIRPFTTEWNYKVIVPAGYKLRALPPDRDEKMGTARFVQKYSSNADGTVVEAVLHFESGKSRLTVGEAKTLRDAVVKAQKSDPIFITFDQVGQSLIAAGKVREGLASYQQLIDLHPKEALHRVQFARGLLAAGLGEKARSVAREATVLDPNSAEAWTTLGWILQHDLIGRRLKKGFDYEGAVSAYRKAKALDPKDKDLRANLAYLLEFDASGERYSAKAHLREAVAEFTELKKLDQEYAEKYDDNVLYDLWYLRDISGLEAALAKLPATATRRGFVLAATAAAYGSDAALKKSLEITTDDGTRSKALNSAGWFLVHVYKYSVAADLLTAGARGQNNEAQSAAYATALKKAVPRDQFKPDASSPDGALQRFFSLMFTADPQYEQLLSLMSKNSTRSPETKRDQEQFHHTMYGIRKQVEKSGLPFITVGDIALPNMTFSREGSDAEGYKVRVIAMGAEPQDAFVVREDNVYKLLSFAGNNHKNPEEIGWQALQELDQNHLDVARKWLDWAREAIHINDNDDPLAGNPFPHFWTKGHEGDATEIRRAALALVPSKELKPENIAELVRLRDSEKSDEQKGRLDLVIVYAYKSQERWADLVPVAERLVKAYPESVTAFDLAAAGYAATNRFDDWQKLLDERLAKHADELDYTRSAASLARYRGDYARSRQILKGVMDRGKATSSDLNLYAWDALFIGAGIDNDSIEAAEHANQMTKNSSFAVMHTLACLYARAGKPAKARDLLLSAMDAGYLEEPDSSVWLAYGVIAEEDGALDAARAMYARVEKLKTEAPGSNYQLAQLRLASLGKPGTTTAARASR